MKTREPAQESKKPGDIFSKDIPFEIFTPAEVKTILSHVPDADLQKAIQYIISRINQGMHNKTIGWYKQIESRFYKQKEVIAGARAYLDAANRLQAPKEGRCIHYVTANGQEKSSIVDVNKGFWDDCIGAIPSSLAATLAEQYTAEKPPYEKAKIHIYSLLRIKKNMFAKLDDIERPKIAINIDSALKIIYSTAKCATTFILDEKEIKESHHIRDEQQQKQMRVSVLRLLLESTPDVVRYIHIRPAILIQFAQSLDYLYEHIECTHRLTSGLVASVFPGKSSALKHPALEKIDKKRMEMASVMAFQELLFDQFGSDDYIEALHLAIENCSGDIFNSVKTKIPVTESKQEQAMLAIQNRLSNACLSVLPTKSFFNADKKQIIQIIEFESDDPDKPQTVQHSDMSIWRKKYIALHSSPNQSISETKDTPKPLRIKEHQVTKVEKKSFDDSILKTELIHVVQRLEPLAVRVPSIIVPKLFQLQESMRDIIHSNIFEFFVTHHKQRKIFYQNMNQYAQQCKRNINVLLDQVERGISHYTLFEPLTEKRLSLFNARKPRDLTHETKLNFSALAAGIAIFSDSLKEIECASIAMKSAIDEIDKFVFLKYINHISGIRNEFHESLLRILGYWNDYIEHIDFRKHERPEVESLRDLIISVGKVLDCEENKSSLLRTYA